MDSQTPTTPPTDPPTGPPIAFPTEPPTAFPAYSATDPQAEYPDLIGESTDNQQRGSYLTGLLGALLGAIVGAIPTIVAIVVFQMIYVILCALIPLASAFGYRLFKGKASWVSVIFVAVFSLIMAFVVQIATLYVAVFQFYGEWLPVVDTVIFYFQILEGDVLKDLLFTLLFVVIGIVITLPFSLKVAKKDIETDTNLMDSVENNEYSADVDIVVADSIEANVASVDTVESDSTEVIGE